MQDNDYYLDIDSFTECDKYQDLDIKSKNKLLLEIISKNLKLFQREKEKGLNEKKIIKEELSLKKDPVLKSEKPKVKNKNDYMEKDYSYLEGVDLEEILYFLPKSGDKDFSLQINVIMCHLRLLIDSYDTLLQDTKEDPDLSLYIQESTKQLEKKLEYIKLYKQHIEEQEEHIALEKVAHLNIIYFNYYGQNLFLSDLLGEDSDKYASYLLLLNSIKGQTFRELKRIYQNDKKVLYEVRHDQQRIVFDIISDNTIIVIQAFTKKVLNDKKYRLNLDNRISKYIEVRNYIRENKEKLVINAIDDDRVITELLMTRNKKIVKKENEVWKS